mgnify:CR=1 FL=1
MIQFAGNTFYLIGALLCYIILPAVTRANNIWNGRPFEKNEGLFLKDTAAMIGASTVWPIMLPYVVILWLYYAFNILVWTSLEHKNLIKRKEGDIKRLEAWKTQRANELLNQRKPPPKDFFGKPIQLNDILGEDNEKLNQRKPPLK